MLEWFIFWESMTIRSPKKKKPKQLRTTEVPEKSNLRKENCNSPARHCNKFEIWSRIWRAIKLWQELTFFLHVMEENFMCPFSPWEGEHDPPRAADVSRYTVFQQPLELRLTPINLPSHVTQNVDRDEWRLSKGPTETIEGTPSLIYR